MLLLLLLNIRNSNKISLEFDERINDFNEFEKIFKSLRELDKTCEMFYGYYKSQEANKVKVISEVQYLSKQSPFEITAFVTDHWFEIFLFVWGSYDKILQNPKLILEDAKQIINNRLKSLNRDLPNIDYEKLTTILEWFNDLPKKDRDKIVRKMLRQRKSFSKIIKIKFEKM